MSPKEYCEKHGVTTLQLFKSAYDMFGYIYGTGGPNADCAWMQKWGTVPVYVKKYLAREDAGLNAEHPSQ